MTNILQELEAGFQKDEQWVITEITKGWNLLETVGQTIEVDIKSIFTWIQTHQAQILSVFQQALTVAEEIGTLGSAAAPVVAFATTAIDAATAAVDTLSTHVIAGTTPLSVAVSAFHAVKDASTAVNAVVKAATTQPVKK